MRKIESYFKIKDNTASPTNTVEATIEQQPPHAHSDQVKSNKTAEEKVSEPKQGRLTSGRLFQGIIRGTKCQFCTKDYLIKTSVYSKTVQFSVDICYL